MSGRKSQSAVAALSEVQKSLPSHLECGFMLLTESCTVKLYFWLKALLCLCSPGFTMYSSCIYRQRSRPLCHCSELKYLLTLRLFTLTSLWLRRANLHLDIRVFFFFFYGLAHVLLHAVGSNHQKCSKEGGRGSGRC